jgi:hypothetical protein
LACGEVEKARLALVSAQEMTQQMSYHRRDSKVTELETMF